MSQGEPGGVVWGGLVSWGICILGYGVGGRGAVCGCDMGCSEGPRAPGWKGAVSQGRRPGLRSQLASGAALPWVSVASPASGLQTRPAAQPTLGAAPVKGPGRSGRPPSGRRTPRGSSPVRLLRRRQEGCAR